MLSFPLLGRNNLKPIMVYFLQKLFDFQKKLLLKNWYSKNPYVFVNILCLS